MQDQDVELIRMEIAFWALSVIAMLGDGLTSGMGAIGATCCWYAMWRHDRRNKPQGPGFWARVWRR